MTSSAKATAGKAASDQILAFACDEDTLAAICRVVPGGRRGVEVREGGLGAAAAAIQQGARPEFLIVDLSDSGNPIPDLTRVIAACGPDATVVAIGPENDVGLYRALIGAGVTDYLVKPVTSQELRRTILAAGRQEEQPEQTTQGRCCAIVGARGGVGSSSIATGVAWLLADQFRKQVALVDLDLHFGTVALSLDVEIGNGLRSALENADRIDSLFVASALVNVTDSLFVLGGEEPLDQSFTVEPAALEQLIAELRRIFDIVVLDLPRHLVPVAASTLATVNALAVVTDLSLAGLRDTSRIKAGLARIAPDAAISLVANRVGLEKANEISAAEFERGVGGKLDFVMTEEAKAAKAALSGKTLAAALRGSRTAAPLEALARKLGAIDAGAGRDRRGWLRRWR